MAASRTVELAGRTVTVRELTVGQVRDWLVEVESGKRVDPLQALAFDGFGLDDLAQMADATAADLEAYTPSELQPLIDAARGLNPHFFRVRAALSGVARLMLNEAEALISTAPPASS